MLTKEQFLEYIDFIEDKNAQQMKLADIFSDMCPGFYCDTLVYSDIIDKLLDLLAHIMNDTSELIEYKMYEYNNFSKEDQLEELKENPECESWETVYNYLINKNKE